VLGDDHVLAGAATGVDPDGHLLVDDADGLTHTVVVGDVVHLRPAD
jgi:biotin-(acetyl-CoA carboxylase) ligase